MGRFGFCGGSYTSQSPNADAQRTMNFIPETIESGSGKSSIVLYPTPGLKKFATLPARPVRGEISTNGRCFAIGGDKFCEISSTGAVTVINTVANDAKPASMVAGMTQVLIASGGKAYYYDMSDSTFAEIDTNGNDALQDAVVMVDYSDGYYLALLADGQRWQVSGLNDVTTWDPTMIAEVSVYPSGTAALIVSHREPWLFGNLKTQPYYDSGNTFPFDPISGATIEQGIAAPRSVVRMDNTLFWIGQDERGRGIAWRANGYLPQRVSGHAQEWAWGQYPTISDAVAYSYQSSGHTFWVIYFPAGNATWVYDAATGLWHERAQWDTLSGMYQAHPGWCHCFCFGKHLVGDWASGKVYEMSNAYYTDDGIMIRRARRAPYIAMEGTWIFVTRLEIEGEYGEDPNPAILGADGNPRAPQIMLRWSDDGARNWSNEYWISAGKIGEYGMRAIFRRLGRFWGPRGRVFEVIVTDPVPWRFVDAYIEASPGYEPSERISAQYRKVS